jgi:hypothetical protein
MPSERVQRRIDRLLDQAEEAADGRDVPGDQKKSVELQDEAIAIAIELGMKPLLERVLAQREILKA